MTTADEFLADVKERRQRCEHLSFRVNANVFRLTKEGSGRPTGFTAEIRVICADCGHPFVWKGVPFGASFNQPMLKAPTARNCARPSSPRILSLNAMAKGKTDMNWRAKLRAFRKKHKLTQKQLSGLLPAGLRTVEDWEREKRTPPPILKRALRDLERELSTTNTEKAHE
jgi:DNA-binding transcriptional regulator YiaG